MENRTKFIKFRVNENELDSINSKVPSGVSRSTFIKTLLLKQKRAKAKPCPKFDPNIKLSLDAIGRNINQLVRKSHTGEIDSISLDLTLSLYLEELQRVTAILNNDY